MIALPGEVGRLVRHAVVPVVVIAIERGWLPAAAKDDATEFLVIGISLAIAYLWSLWNERNRARAELGAGQSPGAVDAGGSGRGAGPASAGPSPEAQGEG